MLMTISNFPENVPNSAPTELRTVLVVLPIPIILYPVRGPGLLNLLKEL